MENRLFVGVEAGGTKFVVGVETSPGDLRRSAEIQTRTPEETLPAVVSAIREMVGNRSPDGVGVAALAEHTWGAGQDADPLIYLTVGTGVGGGLFCNGRLVHGMLHPEMGHILVPSAPGDEFVSICPSHNSCLALPPILEVEGSGVHRPPRTGGRCRRAGGPWPC